MHVSRQDINSSTVSQSDYSVPTQFTACHCHCPFQGLPQFIRRRVTAQHKPTCQSMDTALSQDVPLQPTQAPVQPLAEPTGHGQTDEQLSASSPIQSLAEPTRLGQTDQQPAASPIHSVLGRANKKWADRSAALSIVSHTNFGRAQQARAECAQCKQVGAVSLANPLGRANQACANSQHKRPCLTDPEQHQVSTLQCCMLSCAKYAGQAGRL